MTRHVILVILLMLPGACTRPAPASPTPPRAAPAVIEPAVLTVPDALVAQLASGFTVAIELRGSGGALVGTCTVAYELWDELYIVDRGKQGYRDIYTALGTCIDERSLQHARGDARTFKIVAVEHVRAELAQQRQRTSAMWCGGATEAVWRPDPDAIQLRWDFDPSMILVPSLTTP